MATILVSGAIANKPCNGGEAWVRLSWTLGLARLGFDVWLVEQLDQGGFDDRNRIAYFADVVATAGIAGRAALVAGDGPRTWGASWEELLDVAAEAVLLVNISGHLTSRPLMGRLRRRAFVDIDPGYTHFWHAAGLGSAHVGGHHLHFTIAENIGAPDCLLPIDGVRWLPTRQPVVLADWPPAPHPSPRRFTSVANWRNPFGRIEHGGRTYGMKLDEFRKVAELPVRCGQRFELALDIHPDERRDLELLRRNRWSLVDPRAVAGTPEAFRRYVRSSAAEFSVAQGVYVETNSGWFSDRTVRYLASGRPVLVQETGFSRHLPTGTGIVPFATLEEAVAGADAIAADYDAHAAAARRIAEAHFDSDQILARFVEDCDVAP